MQIPRLRIGDCLVNCATKISVRSVMGQGQPRGRGVACEQFRRRHERSSGSASSLRGRCGWPDGGVLIGDDPPAKVSRVAESIIYRLASRPLLYECARLASAAGPIGIRSR